MKLEHLSRCNVIAIACCYAFALVAAPTVGYCKDKVVTYQASKTSGNTQKVGQKEGGSVIQPETNPSPEKPNKPEQINPTPDEKAPPHLGGKLTVTYNMPKEQELREIAELLKETRGFDEIVQSVNESFKVPAIKVLFDTCGEPNAFYNADNKQITMCYELFHYLNERFSEDDELSEEEVGVKVAASTIFTFFHELGHAFVHVFDLPVTGREEDAVDDLATIILLTAEEDDDESEIVTDALQSFWVDAEETIKDAYFWGEHSLNLQRGARMLCLAYGSNPNKYEDWVGGDDGLPEDRAQSCPAEFELMEKSWERLLEPYVL